MVFGIKQFLKTFKNWFLDVEEKNHDRLKIWKRNVVKFSGPVATVLLAIATVYAALITIGQDSIVSAAYKLVDMGIVFLGILMLFFAYWFWELLRYEIEGTPLYYEYGKA